MREMIVKGESQPEAFIPEQCYIRELWGSAEDKVLSIAQARVTPGSKTKWHRLKGIRERYLVVAGQGRVEVGDLRPTEVIAGDLVFIPAGTRQRITNTGSTDLVFYCICDPPFDPACYQDAEDEDR